MDSKDGSYELSLDGQEPSIAGKHGATLRQIILGGQDGVVNVLGIVLGVATATNDARLVIITGLAATFAESLSMGAVAYTSTKAAVDSYNRELEREIREIKEMPDEERKEIRRIYMDKGFSGELLEKIVRHITSDKKLWLDTMMKDELNLTDSAFENPEKEALMVFAAAMVGSLVPLAPFFFVHDTITGIAISLIFSTLVLGAAGVVKARLTVGDWKKSALEMMFLGVFAAGIGYAIGKILGVAIA